MDSDLISSLPDPILHQILGLLQTKEAVQTCVLSKRWEHLWTSLPCLRFDFCDFLGRSTAPCTDVNCDDDDGESLAAISSYLDSFPEAVYGRFSRFINALLLRLKTLDLDVFNMSYPGCFCYSDFTEQVRGWIQYAVEHNTRILHLNLCGSLPSCTWMCTSLEELHLNQCMVDVSGIVNLPKLRKLSYHYGGNLKNILAGSPILENLCLNFFVLDEWVIDHDNLKHLAITDYFMAGEPKLLVSATNLLSFFYDGPLPLSSTLHMPSLLSACIISRDNNTLVKCMTGIAAFIRCFANVELLQLHIHINWQKELSPVMLSELPTFKNLKLLTVAIDTYSFFKMVTWILKSSPNLKKLTLLQQIDG